MSAFQAVSVSFLLCSKYLRWLTYKEKRLILDHTFRGFSPWPMTHWSLVLFLRACGGPSWQEHVVRQNHSPEGQKWKEEKEETRVLQVPFWRHDSNYLKPLLKASPVGDYAFSTWTFGEYSRSKLYHGGRAKVEKKSFLFVAVRVFTWKASAVQGILPRSHAQPSVKWILPAVWRQRKGVLLVSPVAIPWRRGFTRWSLREAQRSSEQLVASATVAGT